MSVQQAQRGACQRGLPLYQKRREALDLVSAQVFLAGQATHVEEDLDLRC